MEINQLVTQDNADSGVWTQVTLYDKPADFDLLILGDDSDAVQQHGRKSLKKLKSTIGRSAQSKETEFDDETIDELADSGDEAVLVRIAGIRGWKVERKGGKEISREQEPVTLNGIELKNDQASFKLLISKIPAVKEFVLKVSRDRTNFLSKPSGN
jgi:hypothetical protein